MNWREIVFVWNGAVGWTIDKWQIIFCIFESILYNGVMVQLYAHGKWRHIIAFRRTWVINWQLLYCSKAVVVHMIDIGNRNLSSSTLRMNCKQSWMTSADKYIRNRVNISTKNHPIESLLFKLHVIKIVSFLIRHAPHNSVKWETARNISFINLIHFGAQFPFQRSFVCCFVRRSSLPPHLPPSSLKTTYQREIDIIYNRNMCTSHCVLWPTFQPTNWSNVLLFIRCFGLVSFSFETCLKTLGQWHFLQQVTHIAYNGFNVIHTRKEKQNK